ncbi:tetratricopeptide repeat protein, partial [bacterium]|nr:tetratricopeptide repeat protein [bacterium]
LLLARTLYALGEHKSSLEVVQSINQSNPKREARQIIAKNYAAQEDWSKALSYLRKLLSEAQEIEMLNLAARCYLNLDQPHKALPLLQKSLKLNPQQQTIKDLKEKTKKQLK